MEGPRKGVESYRAQYLADTISTRKIYIYNLEFCISGYQPQVVKKVSRRLDRSSGRLGSLPAVRAAILYKKGEEVWQNKLAVINHRTFFLLTLSNPNDIAKQQHG